MSDRPETPGNAVSNDEEWSVYQCPHGCLHVRLNNVLLTFTEREFQRLVRMLGDAYVRLSVREVVRQVSLH